MEATSRQTKEGDGERMRDLQNNSLVVAAAVMIVVVGEGLGKLDGW